MTVKEVIRDLKLLNIRERLAKLESMGAPSVIIDNLRHTLSQTESGDFKVNGLARKHKIADEEVIQLEQADAVGNYYKYGKNKTIVLKITTASGTYYYDYYGNKIGKELELEVSVAGLKFKQVQM